MQLGGVVSVKPFPCIYTHVRRLGDLWQFGKKHTCEQVVASQETTLAAMRAHPDCAEVQEEACLVLYNLAYDRENYRQVDSELLVLICILYACIRHNLFVMKPQRRAQVMVAAGGPEAVLHALDRHSAQDHSTLHKYAGWCLERLEGQTPGSHRLSPRGACFPLSRVMGPSTNLVHGGITFSNCYPFACTYISVALLVQVTGLLHVQQIQVSTISGSC